MPENPYEVSQTELNAAKITPPAAASFRFTWLRISIAAALATVITILTNTLLLTAVGNHMRGLSRDIHTALGESSGPRLGDGLGAIAVTVAFFIPAILVAVGVFGLLVRVLCWPKRGQPWDVTPSTDQISQTSD